MIIAAISNATAIAYVPDQESMKIVSVASMIFGGCLYLSGCVLSYPQANMRISHILQITGSAFILVGLVFLAVTLKNQNPTTR
jgi:hypothetical protein